MAFKVKPGPVQINVQDIAAANISFTLVQVLIEMLIQRNVIQSNEMKEALAEMAKLYSAPGDPARKPIRDAIAEFARSSLVKFDAPPKEKQT